MEVASASSKTFRGQSSIDGKQMLHLSEKLYNDSIFLSTAIVEFEQRDPQSSSSSLVSVENLQQQCSGTGIYLDRKVFAESIQQPPAGLIEMAHIMQGRVGSYPANQPVPIAHDSIGRALSGEFGSLGFDDLPDFWADVRLYSQEIEDASTFPPQTLESNEGLGGDPMTTTSVGRESPSGLRSCNYSIPSCLGEGNDLESPRTLQPEQRNSSPQPVATGSTSVGLISDTLIYNVSSRPSKLEDGTLPFISSCQPEFSERTLSPSLQPSSSRKSRFHSQSLVRSRVQDAAVVEHYTDALVDSKVKVTRQHNDFQQAPSLSMSTSLDVDRRRQAGECSTGGKANQFTCKNLNSLKLKQKSQDLSFARPPPRKYQRLRAGNGMDMEHDMEADSVPMPLDHVQRERQRRDLMTSKIAALELLLPKSSKRDRVSVVYDAIQLLKRLEREVKVLHKRLHEATQRRASLASSLRSRHSIPKAVDCSLGTSGSYFSNGVVVKRLGTYMKPIVIRSHPTRATSRRATPIQKSTVMSSARCLGECDILDNGKVFVEFHVHLDDTVTIQEEELFKCQCRMDYLSTMMIVVDEFRLDVITCNIMKLSGYFICIVGLKTRTRKNMTTAAQFVARLQSVVDFDIVRRQLIQGAKLSGSIEE